MKGFLPEHLREGRKALPDAPGASWPGDLLFHVLMRLDAVSLLRAAGVGRQWRAAVRSALAARGLDVRQVRSLVGDAKTARFFAALAGSYRVQTLILAPELPVAPFLVALRLPFGDALRHLDLAGCQVSNHDLKLIPKRVYERLRTLIVAPEAELISLLSLAPVAQNCRSLVHFRWQGFVVCKAAYLSRVVESNSALDTLRIESHSCGWRLQNEHLRALGRKNEEPSRWRTLHLAYGQFASAQLCAFMKMQENLRHLSLEGTLLYQGEQTDLARALVASCKNLKTVFLPLEAGWDSMEVIVVGLPQIRWVETMVFGRVWRRSLLERASGEDMTILSDVDGEWIDILWDEILQLKFFDRQFAAAALFARLNARSQTLFQYLPTVTIGALEWLCAQRAVISHHVELENMNLTPVYEFERPEEGLINEE